jgi:hypothetical protein
MDADRDGRHVISCFILSNTMGVSTTNGWLGLVFTFSSSSHNNGDWIDLTDNTNGGVLQKRILVEGPGESYPSGTSAVTDYTGTLASADWSVTEVLNCWLSEQQGLDHLADGFRQEQVDEAKMTDLDVFTETFARETLGVTAKIACKKLVLAAKRLAMARREYPPGMEFDSNDNYEFTLGSGKLIRGHGAGCCDYEAGRNGGDSNAIGLCLWTGRLSEAKWRFHGPTLCYTFLSSTTEMMQPEIANSLIRSNGAGWIPRFEARQAGWDVIGKKPPAGFWSMRISIA